jgi:hypothetical protein
MPATVLHYGADFDTAATVLARAGIKTRDRGKIGVPGPPE